MNSCKPEKNTKKIAIIALNKPKGVICTHKDLYNRTKIYDLIPKKVLKLVEGKLHSVGRLDFNSQGLILLTNNTKVKKILETPSSKVKRIYKVKIQGNLNNDILNKIKRGVLINKVYFENC